MSSAEYQAPCQEDSQRSSSANSQAFSAAEGDHHSGHQRAVLRPEEQIAQPAIQVVRPVLPREKIEDQGRSSEGAHTQPGLMASLSRSITGPARTSQVKQPKKIDTQKDRSRPIKTAQDRSRPIKTDQDRSRPLKTDKD